jgi:hypothetical protein
MLPIMCAHGTSDGINSIERVRQDIMMSKSASLHEFQDDHGLEKLTSSDSFAPLLLTLYDRTASHEMHSQWINTERPVWIKQDLEPKLGADASVGKAELANAREMHKTRVGLLAALRTT